jgi:hypothetical protein
VAIELPSEVVFFLNMVGVPYPDINEDDVKTLAEHVRTFATNVQNTHESASGVINDMGSVYSGYSYEQLLSTWANMSATHMADLDSACRFVAKALDIAAEVITVVKVVVLAELAALAASYLGAIVIPGMQPMTVPLGLSARNICSQMQQMLVGYIVAEVIGKAIEPLEKTIEEMIKGVVYGAASNLLGVPDNGSAGIPLRIDPDEVQRYAKVLDEHADDIMQHAATFAASVAPLDFTTPVRFDETPNSAPPAHRIAPTAPIESAGTGPSANARANQPLPAATGPQVSDRPPATANGSGDDRQSTGAPGQRAVGAGQPAGEAGQSTGEATQPGNAPGQSSATPGRSSGTPGEALPSGDTVDRGDGGRNTVMSPAASAPADAVGSRPGVHPGELDQAQGRHPGVQVAATDSSGVALGAHTQPIASGDNQPLASSEATPAAGSSAPSQPGRGGAAGRATPWGRTKSKTPKSAKPRRPKAVRPSGAVSSEDRKPVETPWSKAGRTPDVAAAVFAPKTDGPAPQSRKEKAAEKDRDAVAADKAAVASGPPRVTAPTVAAPALEADDPQRSPTKPGA